MPPHHHLFWHPFGTSGYLAIFLVVAIESLGVPVPGETALLAGAAVAASGRLSLVVVIATAAMAAIAGGAMGYCVGSAGGAPFVERYGRIFGLTPERNKRMNDFFAHHGPEAVFFGRFVSILRTWASLLAGTARMPFLPFLFYTTLGAVAWAVLFGMLGYLFGHSLPVLEHRIGMVTICLVGVAIVIGLIYFLRRRRTRRQIAGTDGNESA